MRIKGRIMRLILGGIAVVALAGCGQSDGSGKVAVGSGGGQSANIAEGTIGDAMIDLSASEGYGATSTVDESASAALTEGENDKRGDDQATDRQKPKSDDKKPANDNPEKEEAKAEAPAPSESEE
jgi:hypothetical protein